MNKSSGRIWFIDDDPDDQYLFNQALQCVANAPDLHCFYDAAEMLNQLSSHECITPDIIVMDINLPGIDGLQALNQLKQSANYCHIPVLMYSTSQAERDISECYRSGANSVISKPGSYNDLLDTVSIICHYWFSVSLLHRQ